MTALPRVSSKHLFDYELKGEANADLQAELDGYAEVPELSLDGDWTPAGYRELVTNMMKTMYETEPVYNESERLCSKREITFPARDGNDAPGRFWPYRPPALKDDPAAPAIVYVHGGGSVGGCLEDFGPFCAHMAVETGTVVCGVSYRLTPDTQYPFTMLDSYVCVKHVAENAVALGIDPARIAMSGDSAGGYQVLASVAKLAQNDEGHLLKLARTSVAQIFDYFFTEPAEKMNSIASATVQESVAVMDWMTGGESERHLEEKNPLLFPGLASNELLAKYPPMIIIEQEFDNYRTTNERLAARLDEAGRLLEYVCYPGCGHAGGHPNEASDLVKMFDVYLK